MHLPDPLDRPATRGAIEALYASGRLTAAARQEAVARLCPPRAWWAWVERLLLYLGAVLLLAGIVFFFAWNWADMSPAFKFGLIGGGMVVCLAGAVVCGLDRITGQILLTGAAVLTGVFIAVHGQVYQTGADAYELFIGWAVLITPWTLLGRFAPLWVLWLAVANTGVFLWWDQAMVQSTHHFPSMPFLTLAVLNGLALIGREWGARAGRRWLAAGWHRWLMLAAVLTWLTIPVMNCILEWERADAWTVAAVPMWAAALAVVYIYYRHRAPDLAALTLGAAALCTGVLTGLGRLAGEVLDTEPLLLVLGFMVLGVVSLAVVWLRGVHRALAAARSEGDDVHAF
jgi:uncharacterized membrane protein